MPVVLFEKDPFVDSVANTKSLVEETNVNVRRPLYGVSIKEPRHAFIALYQAGSDGTLKGISIYDSSAPSGDREMGGHSFANHNFIIQRVQEQRQEKFQIVETFGDHFTFFYGERPIILEVSGMLINTEDFNWKNEWLKNYDQFLRGTKCVENRARVFLGWDDVLAEGYILTTQVTYSMDLPYLCPFGFQILLTRPPMDLSNPSVSKQEEARQLASYEFESSLPGLEGEVIENDELIPSDTFVEYLSEIKEFDYGAVDPSDGNVKTESASNANTPKSLDDGTVSHTAFWVTGTNPPLKQWKNRDEALVALDTRLAADQSESDLTTARLLMKTAAESFPLSSRSGSSDAISTALGTGVSNTAAVIDDAPVLE